MKADIFKDIVPSILQTKNDILIEEKDYVPYLINRAMSNHYDCVLAANEMNMAHFLDNRVQYDFYLNRIRAYKRSFAKWHKKDKIDDLEVVKEYYNYSDEKAKEALNLLSDDQINELKKRNNKGGLNNAKRINRSKTT